MTPLIELRDCELALGAASHGVCFVLPSLRIESRLADKLAAVAAFARVNSIDREVIAAPGGITSPLAMASSTPSGSTPWAAKSSAVMSPNSRNASGPRRTRMSGSFQKYHSTFSRSRRTKRWNWSLW